MFHFQLSSNIHSPDRVSIISCLQHFEMSSDNITVAFESQKKAFTGAIKYIKYQWRYRKRRWVRIRLHWPGEEKERQSYLAQSHSCLRPVNIWIPCVCCSSTEIRFTISMSVHRNRGEIVRSSLEGRSKQVDYQNSIIFHWVWHKRENVSIQKRLSQTSDAILEHKKCRELILVLDVIKVMPVAYSKENSHGRSLVLQHRTWEVCVQCYYPEKERKKKKGTIINKLLFFVFV